MKREDVKREDVSDGAELQTLEKWVWRFRALRGWTVRMVNDPDNHGVSWGGRHSNNFSIGTWDKKDGQQPPDYILHEVLHAAVIAVVRMDKRKPKEQRQAEEMLVQDLCRIIMPPEEIRTVQDLVRAITPAFGTGLWREREERVLRLRLVEGLTLRECAAQFGVTRERIRHIEGKALRKWRQKGGGR